MEIHDCYGQKPSESLKLWLVFLEEDIGYIISIKEGWQWLGHLRRVSIPEVYGDNPVSILK